MPNVKKKYPRLVKRKQSEKGFSLIEVVLASAVLSTVVLGSVTLQSAVMQTTRKSNDRAFATEKVVQMFEEMRSYTEANQESADFKLTNFSDGVEYNSILTTENNASIADSVLSKNKKRAGGNWKYVRQVQVDPIPNDNFAKHIKVTIWYGDENGQPKGKALASISGILKTNIPTTPPSQVFDYYTVAISNSPGWWSESYDFRPAYEAVTTDLEYRNPGLHFRKHYISNLGYGRDPFYLPHTNTTAHADSQDLPWSYYYPGKVKAVNSGNQTKEAYVYKDMQSRLRGDVEDKQFHAWNKTQPTSKLYRPTTFADQFNNVMRYPELKAMEKRVFEYAHSMPASLLASNKDAARLKESLLQPTLASFLEDLNSNPSKFRHALITNIHAEQTPLPPLRNFSDPARLPVDEQLAAADPIDLTLPANRYKYMRLVTHPEQLHYENADDLKWRIYAFDMNPVGRDGIDKNPANGNDYTDDEIANRSVDVMTVFLPTDGVGRHPKSGTKSGYLDNPDFTATTVHEDLFSFEKIIGSKNRAYRKINNDPTLTIAGHKFETLTDSHTWRTDLAPTHAANEKVKFVGTLETVPAPAYVGGVSDSIDVNVTPGTAITTTLLREYKDLVNMRLVVDAGKNSATDNSPIFDGVNNVLRVKEVIAHPTKVGLIQITFYPDQSLTTVPRPDSVVTVHKDYEFSTNPTVYGQTRNGVLVKLYDTPTRHERASACPTGGTAGFRCDQDVSAMGDREYNSGLNKDRRLFGLEYIPAPVNTYKTTSGTGFLDDDFDNDLAHLERNRNTIYAGGQKSENDSYLSDRAKNTARWVVKVDTTGNADLDNKLVTLETRFGDEAHIKDGLNGDGDEYQPNDTTTLDDENDLLMRPNLYNVSRTYIYRGNYYPNATEAGDTIPEVEKYQFLGDPRYMPYADRKAAHAYNPNFFLTSGNKNKFGSSGTQWGGYDGFDRQTGKYSGKDDIDADLPRLFSLYANGIMKSNSVYNSIAGYTHYIYSIGGEFGNRGSHNFRYNLKPNPWFPGNALPGGDVTNEENKGNSVAEQGTNAHSRIITASYKPSGGSADKRWFARQHLGELYPDELYQFWKENGNLPNSAYQNSHRINITDNTNRFADTALPTNTNGVVTEFYRATYPDSPMDLRRRERICHEGAISDFYNASRDPGADINDTIIHSTKNGSGKLTAGLSEAGRYLTEAFNLSLPESIGSNRSFCLSQDNGGCSDPHGANSSQFNKPERQAVRNTVKYVNMTGPNQGQTTGTASQHNAFYRFHKGSSASPNKNVSSGMVKLTREAVTGYVTADADMVGYAVINGLKQAIDFGAQSLARLSVAATLQAYLEGGDRAIPGVSAGRIVPLPRVKINTPRTASIETGSTISVDFDVSWKRWDDKKYSPSFPAGWHDGSGLRYQGMYSVDNGKSWTYIQDGTTLSAVPKNKFGYFDKPLYSSASPEVFTTDLVNKTFTWNVSSLSAGNYILRLEAYRATHENGFGYHDVFVTLKK